MGSGDMTLGLGVENYRAVFRAGCPDQALLGPGLKGN